MGDASSGRDGGLISNYYEGVGMSSMVEAAATVLEPRESERQFERVPRKRQANERESLICDRSG